MDFQDFIERQEHWFHELFTGNSLGQLPERFPISFVRPFLRCVELLPPRRWFRGRDDQLFAVGADIERRFGIGLEEVEDRLYR